MRNIARPPTSPPAVWRVFVASVASLLLVYNTSILDGSGSWLPLMPECYYEIEIRIDPSQFDVLIGLLSDWDVEGFLEEERSLKCYVRLQSWTEVLERALRHYVSALESDGTVAESDLRIQKVEQRNWVEEWERSVPPVELTDHIVVRSSWQPIHPEWSSKMVLTIDPKMAFGTGYHESTQLAVKLMERYLQPGDVALDVGTGTGILAIAAARQGAIRVLAIDNDPWACSNALENVQLNRVSDKVAIRPVGLEDLPADLFDLVLANITKNAILEYMSLLAAKLGLGGRLILSGLIETDVQDVLRQLKQYRFAILQTMCENEWVGIAAVK